MYLEGLAMALFLILRTPSTMGWVFGSISFSNVVLSFLFQTYSESSVSYPPASCIRCVGATTQHHSAPNGRTRFLTGSQSSGPQVILKDVTELVMCHGHQTRAPHSGHSCPLLSAALHRPQHLLFNFLPGLRECPGLLCTTLSALTAPRSQIPRQPHRWAEPPRERPKSRVHCWVVPYHSRPQRVAIFPFTSAIKFYCVLIIFLLLLYFGEKRVV